MKNLLMLMASCCAFSACHIAEEREDPVADRTVLVYMAGENSLSYDVASDLDELRTGSTGLGNNRLVVYVDNADATRMPYLLRLKDGIATDSLPMEQDGLTSDPSVMGRVLRLAMQRYPAREYGLVLWGHASGWVLEDSVQQNSARRRAYGIDNGLNTTSDAGKWLNMPTLARVIESTGTKMKFILADCCQFQCVESVYELRGTADYIIGSPAEIPAEGAPYARIMKGLFEQGESFYQTIVDDYVGQGPQAYSLPMSVVKTSELPRLAAATHQALLAMQPYMGAWPDLTDLIYYKGSMRRGIRENMCYDMNDFMLRYAPTDTYQAWKASLDRAVVYKHFSSSWITNGQVSFSLFSMTEDRYGGLSMFIPQQRPGSSYDRYNEDIRKMAWYYDAGLSGLGW